MLTFIYNADLWFKTGLTSGSYESNNWDINECSAEYLIICILQNETKIITIETNKNIFSYIAKNKKNKN
jgi:hypothetical protein